MRNHQVGPPEIVLLLEQLVSELVYKDWAFALIDGPRCGEHYKGSEGLTLSIRGEVPNSVGEGTIRFHHPMPVPPATWDRRTWRRWLFDQIMLVELHEAMELFQVGDDRPFFPAHGDHGGNPYEIREQP